MSFVDDVKIEPVPAKRRVKSDTSKNIEKNELHICAEFGSVVCYAHS
mgnify:CR=1 FL=1